MKRLIAVIEDELEAFNNLNGLIERYAKEKGQEFEVHHFPTGQKFLNDLNTFYAVVFMDIELPDMDGLSIAKQMRKNNKASSLVFVTNLAKYAQFGYEVDAVSYLLKPVEYNSFSIVFTKALNVYSMREERDLILKIPGGLKVTSIDKLMYVEILSHIVIYHAVDGDIERTGSLSQVEKMLKPYGFLRCHNAYLVNPDFVTGIDKNDIIVGSNRVPLARSKKKEFLAELSLYYLKKGNKNELR